MKERTIIYNSFNDMIIWSTWSDGCEVICVHGDHVYYYVPNKLPDMILLTQLMEKMNISEDGRNGIRNTIMELYDDWKAVNKYKPTCKTYTWTISGPVNISRFIEPCENEITCEDDV